MSYVQPVNPHASNFSHFSPLFSFHFSNCLHPKFEFQKLSPLFFPSLPPGFFSLPPFPWRSSLLFSQPRLCLQHSHYSASLILTRVGLVSSDYPKIHKSLSASTTHTLLWALLKGCQFQRLGVCLRWSSIVRFWFGSVLGAHYFGFSSHFSKIVFLKFIFKKSI